MSTFKATIRKKVIRKDGTANIKIRVCHQKKTRYIATDYYIPPKYFDAKTGTVKTGGPYSKDEVDKINNKLQIKLGIMADKAEKQKNIRFMDIGSLMKILRDKHREYDFFGLAEERINKYKKLGNLNYMDLFKFTKNTVENFCGTSILPFESIDFSWLTRLEYTLKLRNMRPNSISIHMRNTLVSD